VIIVIITLVSYLGCTKENDLTSLPQEFSFTQTPAHFPEPVYSPENFTPSYEGFALGRKLFFDPILSKDNSISCASCHHPNAAFSAPVALSSGINGLKGNRNSPAIINVVWQTNFMWDGGITHIEVLPFAPISNPVEMDADLSTIITKLNRHEQYPALFASAFQRDSVDDQQLFWALTQYMAQLVSADSKYDQYVQEKATFTILEKEGLEVFRTHCSSCHSEPLFHDNGFHNHENIPINNYIDSGRFRVTQKPEDMGLFKTPTLRNIALTPPYMHDGSVESLGEVLDAFSPKAFDANASNTLSTKEKEALMAFLRTLTDETFVSNEAFLPTR